VSGAGVDPAERARILLLRGDELLASGTPESLDEAMLAYEGGLEVAREPGVDDGELPGLFEQRIADVRRRLDPSTADEEEAEDEAGEPGDEEVDDRGPDDARGGDGKPDDAEPV
jgi:hypothetical protein